MGMFRYSPTQGIARGEQKDRAIAVGGVGGVLGIGEREKRHLQRHPEINKIDASVNLAYFSCGV